MNGLGEVVKYGLLAGEELFDVARGATGASVRAGPGLAERGDQDLRPLQGGGRRRGRARHRPARGAQSGTHDGARAGGHASATGGCGHGEAVALGLLVALAVSEKLLGTGPEREAPDGGTARMTWDLPVLDRAAACGRPARGCGPGQEGERGFSGFVGLRALGDPVWRLTLPDGLFDEALEVIRA